MDQPIAMTPNYMMIEQVKEKCKTYGQAYSFYYIHKWAKKKFDSPEAFWKWCQEEAGVEA